MLNVKDVIPLSTHEPNKLARDETPHLVIHIIIYMAIAESQRVRLISLERYATTP